MDGKNNKAFDAACQGASGQTQSRGMLALNSYSQHEVGHMRLSFHDTPLSARAQASYLIHEVFDVHQQLRGKSWNACERLRG